jgi:NitT/TauT family transport system substrate-binding protein
VVRSRALILAAAAALPTRIAAQAAPPIRLGSSTSGEGYYEAFYAEAFGFFKNAGLNVETIPTPNGAVVAAASGRAIDVGFTDVVVVANAVNHGLPWTAIAGGGLYSGDAPTTVLCVAKEGAVRSARDLAGQAIGVLILASVSSLGVKAWLDASGVDSGSVKFLQLPYTSMLTALNRGDIAAALISEPVLSSVKKDVRVFANVFDAIAKSFLITCCFTTRDWLSANPTTARRLARALDDAARWANAHQNDTATVLAERSRVPVETVRGTTRVRYGSLEARLVQPVLDVAAKYKAIEKPLLAADVITLLR